MRSVPTPVNVAPGVWSIPITRGLAALVSEQDVALVSPYRWIARGGPVGGKFYAFRNSRLSDNIGRPKRALAMHRIIIGAAPGDIVDHINGDSLDNRRGNLRITDVKGNTRNRGLHRNNTSGFKGVTWSKGKWCAQIKVDRRNRGLGAFATPEEAARAYDAGAIRFFGEFASLNFPEAAPC